MGIDMSSEVSIVSKEKGLAIVENDRQQPFATKSSSQLLLSLSFRLDHQRNSCR